MNSSKTRRTALFFVCSAICLLIRLLPYRPLQTSLMLTIQMPMSTQWGSASGFIFGFLHMVLFDFITGHVGWWTLTTAISYGILAYLTQSLIAHNATSTRYLFCAISATLCYDIITGIVLGPWLFGQTFLSTCINQIPFTIMHLVANGTCSLLLSKHLETVMRKEVVVSPLLKEQKSWQII